MRQAWRVVAGMLAVGALAAGGSVALADDGGGRGGRDNSGPGNAGDRGAVAAARVFTMTADDGNPEGVAFDRRSGQFFVSRTGTGAIFSGTLGSSTLQPFIAGGQTGTAPPNTPLATGLKVRRGLLYVAGAGTGSVSVFDIATKALVAQFATGGGFVNDLDLNGDGDIFATDSTKSQIFRIDASRVVPGARGSVADGAVQVIDVSSGITSDPEAFNLNGIVARGDDELIVVQSNTGKLFRIDVDGDDDRGDDDRGDDDSRGDGRRDGSRRGRARAAQAPTADVDEIDVEGGPLVGGDGLLKDRGRLLVVRGETAAFPNGSVTVVKLRRHRSEGEVQREVSDASFAGPATIARARDLLLVVNANFGAPEGTTQFTVTGLDRDAVRGGGGHRGRRGRG